jgi:hypothetical protein
MRGFDLGLFVFRGGVRHVESVKPSQLDGHVFVSLTPNSGSRSRIS